MTIYVTLGLIFALLSILLTLLGSCLQKRALYSSQKTYSSNILVRLYISGYFSTLLSTIFEYIACILLPISLFTVVVISNSIVIIVHIGIVFIILSCSNYYSENVDLENNKNFQTKNNFTFFLIIFSVLSVIFCIILSIIYAPYVDYSPSYFLSLEKNFTNFGTSDVFSIFLILLILLLFSLIVIFYYLNNDPTLVYTKTEMKNSEIDFKPANKEIHAISIETLYNYKVGRLICTLCNVDKSNDLLELNFSDGTYLPFYLLPICYSLLFGIFEALSQIFIKFIGLAIILIHFNNYQMSYIYTSFIPYFALFLLSAVFYPIIQVLFANAFYFFPPNIICPFIQFFRSLICWIAGGIFFSEFVNSDTTSSAIFVISSLLVFIFLFKLSTYDTFNIANLIQNTIYSDNDKVSNSSALKFVQQLEIGVVGNNFLSNREGFFSEDSVLSGSIFSHRPGSVVAEEIREREPSNSLAESEMNFEKKPPVKPVLLRPKTFSGVQHSNKSPKHKLRQSGLSQNFDEIPLKRGLSHTEYFSKNPATFEMDEILTKMNGEVRSTVNSPDVQRVPSQDGVILDRDVLLELEDSYRRKPQEKKFLCERFPSIQYAFDRRESNTSRVDSRNSIFKGKHVPSKSLSASDFEDLQIQLPHINLLPIPSPPVDRPVDPPSDSKDDAVQSHFRRFSAPQIREMYQDGIGSRTSVDLRKMYKERD